MCHQAAAAPVTGVDVQVKVRVCVHVIVWIQVYDNAYVRTCMSLRAGMCTCAETHCKTEGGYNIV
jgi:hypothetical protein